MFGFFAFLMLFCILFAWAPIILVFVSSWKVHTKAGLPGWSGILPYYNYYVRAEKHNNLQLFWRSLIFVGISCGIMFIGTFVLAITGSLAALSLTAETSGFLTASMLVTILLGIIIYIATMVFMILAIVQLVKIDIAFIAPFGKSTGFAIGMLLLPYVFYPILAWGKNDMKDPHIIDIDSAPFE